MLNPFQNTNVAVEYTRTVFAVTRPRQIVIIFSLHHFIAGAQDAPIDGDLLLLFLRRIEHALQHTVEIHRPQIALAGWAEHLDTRDGGVAVGFGQSGGAQLCQPVRSAR